jgi:hypothetical protein
MISEGTGEKVFFSDIRIFHLTIWGKRFQFVRYIHHDSNFGYLHKAIRDPKALRVEIAKMNNKLKPIKMFGYVLIGASISVVLFTSWLVHQGLSPLFYFTAVVTTWYFLTGIGIIKLTKWGYYLFKFFLVTLFVAFPIGTFISYVTLSYMKKNDIKKYFFPEAPGREYRL